MNDYFTPVKKPVIYDENIRQEYLKLREIRNKEEKVLYSYKVIDAKEGIYQIPVDSAMHIISKEYSERHLP